MNLLELVPHSLEELITQAKELIQTIPELNGINIPDVLRLPIRSHDAAHALLKEGILAIPHIRCIDHTLEESVALIHSLIQTGLKAVLIVSGDKPLSPEAQTFDISPVLLIKTLKKTFPTLKVYAALDPYRQSFKQELAYCHAKILAGADGFFTQPFFDVSLATLFLDQLTQTEIFLGMSPVMSDKSLNYWKTKNMAIFPPQFQLDLDWNCQLGARLVQVAKSRGLSTYLMPITVSALAYAKGVFHRP